jgi:hypothetical protein
MDTQIKELVCGQNFINDQDGTEFDVFIFLLKNNKYFFYYQVSNLTTGEVCVTSSKEFETLEEAMIEFEIYKTEKDK